MYGGGFKSKRERTVDWEGRLSVLVAVLNLDVPRED